MIDPTAPTPIKFDTDASEFVRGFEAGRIWASLLASPAESLEELVHASNTEMVMRIAESTARGVRGEELEDGWLRVTFGPHESCLESDPL